MYSESASPWVSRTCGLTRAVYQQRTKYSSCKYFQCKSTSLQVHESVSPRVSSPQNTLGPPIQPSDQQSTQFLRQADVQVLLWVVVLYIINFVHASPPNPLYFRPEVSQPILVQFWHSPLCYCAVVGITLGANIHGVLKFTWVLLFRNSFDRYLYSWYL